MKREKIKCQKCGREISKSNFHRHFDVCSGQSKTIRPQIFCVSCSKAIYYTNRTGYCNKCKPQATIISEFRKQRKKDLVEYKGGKCQCCGYDKYYGALEFHHVDPTQKDFGIAQDGKTRSWEKCIEEVDKCILVCSVCHKEIHAGIRKIPDEINDGVA